MDAVKIAQFIRRVSETFKRVGIYLSPKEVIKNTHERGVLFPDVNNIFKLIPHELDVIIYSNIFTDEEFKSIKKELDESGLAVISFHFASRNNDGSETVRKCTEMFEKCMEECEVLQSDKTVEDRCTTITLLIVA